MTREEAADYIKKHHCPYYPERIDNTRYEDVMYMAIDALLGCKTDEWCTGCKEYDAEKHCCPRFNHVIREAAKEAADNVRCSQWNVIIKRPMTEEEKQDYEEYFGDIFDRDDGEQAVMYCNLPGDGDEVLICTKYGHVFIDTFEHDGYTCFFTDCDDMNDVVAWMPLPKPYEEVGKW